MRIIKCASCGIKVGVVHEYDYGDCRTNYCDDFNSYYGGEIDGESYCNDCYEEKLEELKAMEYMDNE